MKIDLSRIATIFTDVEFFLTCVFPETPPEFTGSDAGLAVRSGPQFWAVTSLSPAHGRGLAHEAGNNDIVFRGYESELSVHTYSDAQALRRLLAPGGLQNGVFACLKFDRDLQQAVVRSDALGISPLFYRQLGKAWLFASHPALLHLEGDAPDMVYWAGLMQNGLPTADRTFYRDIVRFPAGSEMTLRPGHAETRRWFDFKALPAGTRRADDDTFRAVENAYLAGFERCLRLDAGAVTLPFSSGYDSRRFFGTLVRKQVPFKAVTCQTFHRKNGEDYDLDLQYAPKIAAAFGVDCDLVHATAPEHMEQDARRRQNLVGTETFMHAWVLPMMRWLAARPPSLVFDGLAGDNLGNTGFMYDGLHETPERDAEVLLGEASNPAMRAQLSALFPDSDEFRRQYRAYLGQFATNLNQVELAYLESRTRRCISPSITMMHPPGHVVVFPYCDLDFVRAALQVHPGDKYRHVLQKECLRRFYPEFYDFHGTRNIPKDHAPLDPGVRHARERASQNFLYGDPAVVREALPYLSWPNRMLLLASRFLPSLRRRRGWVFEPLLQLVRTRREAPTFIDRNAAPSSRSGAAGKEAAIETLKSSVA